MPDTGSVMKKHSPPFFDLIGDVHGQQGRLVALLHSRGYHPSALGLRNPEGRKVVFLGDYIDRGPNIREVLQTVRAMVESGDAHAIMGNHEFNAVLFAEPDGRGGFLKQHGDRMLKTHRASLEQFSDRQPEWKSWLEWMKHLPLFLDLGDLRAVHACWDVQSITRLQGKSLADLDFLHACARKGSPEHHAVENVLKGPEMAMPAGYVFHDKEGIARKSVRVRWWNLPERAQVSHLSMAEPFDVPGDACPDEIRHLPCYAPDEPPVFFGHYWLPPERRREPLAPNLACLDYSAAFAANPLTAYRWEGERELRSHHFVTA